MDISETLAAKLQEHFVKTGWYQVTTDEDELYWVFETAPMRWSVTKEVKFGSEYERYTVTLQKDRWRCPCMGMRMHKTCKHVDILKAVGVHKV